jgi:hypothetical protein
MFETLVAWSLHAAAGVTAALPRSGDRCRMGWDVAILAGEDCTKHGIGVPH